ncbi:MAG: SRPBCC domain-containing protein [Desulfobacterales bacterium]|jgi:carbon monoxide dehydrogenase subunit G|nr:SRPBCC domain-containing protein [Desulfobacterales bacterium]MDH4009217.1 SRPBCC domain-containing protein [Desulfobacterales bacterium]
MEMKVGGEGAIDASPEEIWNVIFDPAFMAQVIPGCKDVAQPDEDEYQIKMVLGIPAVQGNYSGILRILEKNPFDIIKGSIEGLGGLGKIDGTWEMKFEKSGAKESRVIYAVNVDISGPMASMVGGFMEQVADSLVKQGLESFNTAITGANENIACGALSKADALPKPNLMKMVFRIVWDAMIKRMGS